MAFQLTRLSCISKKLGTSHWVSRSPIVSPYISRRFVGLETLDTQSDNQTPKDYVIVLPEEISDDATNNEFLRLPKRSEAELDLSAVGPESGFRALYKTIIDYENYISDLVSENPEDIVKQHTVEQFLKELDNRMYPMSTAASLLTSLYSVDVHKYSLNEIFQVFARVAKSKERRQSGEMAQIHQIYAAAYDKMKPIQKRAFRSLTMLKGAKGKFDAQEAKLVGQNMANIQAYSRLFQFNVVKANELSAYTVDDPDLLPVLPTDLYGTRGLHLKERTPLSVTEDNYYRFMQVCPDRFTRKIIWSSRVRRCSPKGPPKFSNVTVIESLRNMNRSVAFTTGHRTLFDYHLEVSMAQTRQRVLDMFETLNSKNQLKLSQCLDDLEEYAANNSPNAKPRELQEYDLDYWMHKYVYDVLIGLDENVIRSFFPFDRVLRGLQQYSKNCLGIEWVLDEDHKGKLWNDKCATYQIKRRGTLLGRIVIDPYHREGKISVASSLGVMRVRNRTFDCLPLLLMSSAYKVDPASRQAHLSVQEIVEMFYCYGSALIRLLNDYDHHELNNTTALESDVDKVVSSLCATHLFKDPKILQSCSVREGNKTIDSELSARILDAHSHFNCMRTARELYFSHLDMTAHVTTTDIDSIAKEMHERYMPLPRNPDNYDYCTLGNFVLGSNAGRLYGGLWSKQLALFYLRNAPIRDGQISSAKEYHEKLLDLLFDSSDLNTARKMKSFLPDSFQPTSCELGPI